MGHMTLSSAEIEKLVSDRMTECGLKMERLLSVRADGIVGLAILWESPKTGTFGVSSGVIQEDRLVRLFFGMTGLTREVAEQVLRARWHD